jgi:hypothetical protein
VTDVTAHAAVEFAPATASTIRDRSTQAGGECVVFDAEVHAGWDIGGSANGGYLLAIAGRAMAEVTGRPPLTVTAHYLAPAPAGPCTVTVDMVQARRRMSTATASLHQGDREIMRVLGTFGEQRVGGPVLVAGGPPELPPYEQCIAPIQPTDGFAPSIFERLAVRFRPGDEGFRTGRPTGVAEIAGWFAFADERPIDAIGLLFAADSFAPAVFNTGLPVAWVPTLELTVHVRGMPAPGPLRCVFRSRFISGGLLEEDGELWDANDTLVCHSRQLALTPR